MRLEAGGSTREGVCFRTSSLAHRSDFGIVGSQGTRYPGPSENQAYGIMRSTFGLSASETSTVPPNLRLVLFAFEVKM
jgi:hypothetical protein